MVVEGEEAGGFRLSTSPVKATGDAPVAAPMSLPASQSKFVCVHAWRGARRVETEGSSRYCNASKPGQPTLV